MNTQRGVTSRWGIPPNPISLTFFGAKKEAKKHPPPPRPPPIWGGCNTKSRRSRRLFSVLVSRDTRYIFYHGSQSLCPFGASHDFFIGWRIVLQDAIIRVSLVYFLIYFLFDCLFEPLSNFIEPLSKGRRKQGCQKRIARPEGAKALRAIQKLCRRAVSARRQLHPFHIGKGLG